MKKHYIPITADVPGADSKSRCALIRKVIRTALAAEGVTAACEVDVLLTDDEHCWVDLLLGTQVVLDAGETLEGQRVREAGA